MDNMPANNNTHTIPGAGDEKLTLGQKFADAVTAGMGSWTFVITQAALLAGWIGVNTAAILTPWDPNLTLLNLALSCETALAGSFIMMSQKRGAEKDRLTAHSDYLLDLEAERDIKELNRKLDILMAALPPDRLKAAMAQIAATETAAQTSINDNGNTGKPPELGPR